MARNPFRGWLQKSFLERNQRVIGAIGILALLGGSAFALLLSGGVFARTYKVTAFFTDAASVTPGDKVTVAGLNAGTVKGVKIEHGQVAMTLAVSKGVELSADTTATVKIQTLLGKKSVQLIDGRSDRPLEDGAVIPASRTTTPVDITQLNDISVNLAQKSDAQALNDLMAEVTQVTEGKAFQIKQVVTGLANLTQAVDSRRTQLMSLIGALKTLSTTLGEKSDTIVSLIDNLNPIVANLAARETDLKNLLVATDEASHTTADLVSSNRAALDSTLTSLHTTLQVLDQHQVDLASTITYLEQSVQGYQSVGYSAGTCGEQNPPCDQGVPNHWANIFVQSLGPLGVDEILGQCGAVDKLIDAILGTDCTQTGGTPPASGGSGNGGRHGSHGRGGGGGGLPFPLPTPSLPIPLPHPSISTPHLPIPTPTLPIGLSYRTSGMAAAPLGESASSAMPGTIGDIVDFVLAGVDGRRQ